MGLLLFGHHFRLAAGCTAGVSSIPDLTDEQEGAGAETGAKWDTDGDGYYYQGGNFPGVGQFTWIGSCLNTEYEGRWNQILGDAPTNASGTNGVWHLMSAIDVRVEYGVNNGTLDGNFTFELRREADSVIILTDAFSMFAEDIPL